MTNADLEGIQNTLVLILHNQVVIMRALAFSGAMNTPDSQTLQREANNSQETILRMRDEAN